LDDKNQLKIQIGFRLIVKFIERAHNSFGDIAHLNDKKTIVHLSNLNPG